MRLVCGSAALDLSEPVVMGVLNVTPDSFFDGGRHADPGAALERALQMVEEGAAIIDVGGESTRPGAVAVDATEEIRRVVPVIERIAARVSVPLSVDTSKPEVMHAAVEAGARMINDVRALALPGALEAAAASGAALCLMHMQGEPTDMQRDPRYADVVADVRDFLAGRIRAALAAGIPLERICVDPGIGFGKRPEHNLELIRHLDSLADPAIPVLVGVSRKSLLGIITGRPAAERMVGSVVLAALCAERGARILRVHDVAPTVDALKVLAALRGPASAGAVN